MNAIAFPEHIRNLRPYVPGAPIGEVARQIRMDPSEIVKLASNENPLGASGFALRALASADIDLSRYSDADVTDLTCALATHLQLSQNQVVVGSGSESLLQMVAAMLLGPGRSAVFSQFSFQAFLNAAHRLGATLIEVPSPELRVDLEKLRAAIRPDTAVVYLVNPGNPTGTCLSHDEIDQFLRTVPAHVCVLLDEAYYEYSSEMSGDSLALVREYDNLVVTRTFSKAYGLAGLRVGYGVTSLYLADVLRKIRPPFSVTTLAQVAAIAALQDTAFLKKTLLLNRKVRQQIARFLDAQSVSYLPSFTNFTLAKVGDGGRLSARLLQRGIIVRPVGNYGLPDWVRITHGTEADTERLIFAWTEGAK